MRRQRSVAQECVAKLKMLADPTRLAVMEMLMEGSKHVGELNAVLTIDQSLLSHHLKVLRESGLVEATRDGKSVLYGLAAGVAAGRGVRAMDLGCCRLSFD